MKKPIVSMTERDRRFYEERLRAFLPEDIVDAHAHVWLERHKAPAPAGPCRTVTWPARVAREQSGEDLEESCRLLFPGKRVVPLIFGNTLDQADDIEANNAYVAACARRGGWPAWSTEGLPAEECVLRDGAPVACDITHPKYERRFSEMVRRWFSAGPDGLNADGVKVDGSLSLPTGPGLKNHGNLWGLELQRRYLSILYEEAKRCEPGKGSRIKS
ncbi:MAG: hypothetical protein PHR35_01205 [Kiritimatiellae bacterium]|nr:hypothetical protein [Kiritimatiellia bacterium]